MNLLATVLKGTSLQAGQASIPTVHRWQYRAPQHIDSTASVHISRQMEHSKFASSTLDDELDDEVVDIGGVAVIGAVPVT